MKFRMLPSAAALTTILLLTGCVPSDPIITPEPEPDATPLFASDEEALAAATEAYGKYLVVLDQILAEGGKSSDRLLGFATQEMLESQSPGFEKAQAENLRSIGSTHFDTAKLQYYDQSAGGGIAAVRLYLCVDVSNVDVLDASGKSVVSETRPDRTPLEVSFDYSGDASGNALLVSSEEQWEGQDFCD